MTTNDNNDPPDAPELLDQIATEPALDELMARSPDYFTPERRRALCVRLRADRAAWEMKREGGGASPAQPAAGANDDDSATEEAA